MRSFRGEFVDQYFPEIGRRGYVEYVDVEEMTRSQAEAIRYSLSRSIRHFERKVRKGSSGKTGVERASTEEFISSEAVKAAQYRAALEDVCSTFDLESS